MGIEPTHQPDPEDTPFAPLPEWILARLRKKKEKPVEVVPGRKVIEGARNVTLTSLAGSMRRRGPEAEEMVPSLLAVNANRFAPPLGQAEVRRIAESIATREAADPLFRAEDWPAPLGAEAYHGLAGDLVKAIEPHRPRRRITQ